jgi:PPIC-type PPIASE domain
MDVANLVYPQALRQSNSVDRPRHRLSIASAKKSLREPLVHFLILGTLLFLVYRWTGGNVSADTNRIVVTNGQVEDLAVGFARSWQRPASEAELKGLIDEHVKEEIAVREATAMGLDRDDTIIRRRLRQKLEFITEDSVASKSPTDAELQDWMTQHPDSFRTEPKVAFREVYLNADRRGASAHSDAEQLLARLHAAGPNVNTDHLGDPTMLPADQELAPLREVARTFGEDFAQQLAKLELGKWTGPIESSFGLHIVLVEKRVEPYLPKLAEVRPLVEREYLNDRRKAELQALYDRLSKKYTITMEKSPASQAANTVGGGSTSR